MSPVNIQTDSIKVVAQAARDLITAINRKTARTVEKTPVPLSDFPKMAEFMWIPGKILTKDGKIHFEPDFLKDLPHDQAEVGTTRCFPRVPNQEAE